MRPWTNIFYACLLMLLPLTGGCISDPEDKQTADVVTVGDKVPLFEVEVTDPRTDSTFVFSSQELRGETVLVFFHTTCKDCQRELPRLNEYYLKHRDEDGFQFVAISREQSAEDIASYWQADSLSLPYAAQTDRRIYRLFANSIIPRVYFCSPEGIITKNYTEVLPEEL